MEVWIEPQCGYAQMNSRKKAAYMHSCEYHQLPEVISKVDKECINALLTLEHLSLMCQVLPPSNDIPCNQQQTGLSGNQPTSSNVNNNCNNNISLNKTTTRRATYPEISENALIDNRIRSMQFDFDTLGILSKCQQAELLFSMFADDVKDQLQEENNANGILMEGLLNHIQNLHNKELILSATDSNRFTKMLAARHREEESKFFFCNYEIERNSKPMLYPRWRCFIKGISVTHVIVTLIPASENDVHLMTYPEEEIDRHVLTTPVFEHQQDDSTSEQLDYKQLEVYGDNRELLPSADASSIQIASDILESNELDYFKNALAFSSPKTTDTYEKSLPSTVENTKRGLILPIYVYDCSLALLIDALIEKLERPRFKDIYHNHTYRMNEQLHEDFINLKSADTTKPSSPEPKSEDSDNIPNDQRNLTEHCKVLSLAHCHSYVVAVYKSLVLQQPLNYDDMDAAVEQCEECLIEINITDYLRAVCQHLRTPDNEGTPCSEMRNMHNLIKDKFKKIINVAFKQVPVHPDFYYCLPSWKNDKLADAVPQASSDSDDEVRFNSEAINGKLCSSMKKGINHIGTIMWSGNGMHERSKLSKSSDSTDSFISDLQMDAEHDHDQPLFLQLNCSIHSKSSFSSTAVKLLPTCFTEITQKLDDYNLKDCGASSGLKITLDIICLNLPKEVLEVSIQNTPSGLRTTSYSSESSMRGGPDNNENSFDRLQTAEGEHMHEGMANLPSHQYAAVSNLVEEIHWLLRDETAAVLLDKSSPTEETLNFVAKHVANSNNRTSCYMDKVPLHFVFSSDNSLPKFMEELKKLTIDRYCIRQGGNLFYFVKKTLNTNNIICVDDIQQTSFKDGSAEKLLDDDNSVFIGDDLQVPTSVRVKKQDSGDPPGYHSEISSIGDNQVGTDDGYEGDSSDSEDDCQWLIDLDHRRDLLPNFWLILRVQDGHVNVYFHCRFLELTSSEVDRYQQVQKTAVLQIKAICQRVNQYLLLRDLHDKRMCDQLLEPESIEDHTWKNAENNSESSSLPLQNQNSNATNVSPGMFRCPIVWEVPFCLHHRLKTGPGKTGMSRGIKALQAVLNRFSVNNRSNMFVYQESNGNVFYLRLHERTSDDRPLQSSKLSESDERLMVSRSSSVASLSQAKSLGISTDQSSSSSTSAMDLLRPRVRSFGERESDILNKSGDSIVLMVHGISEAGPEVRCELVQVLQNRLDDAVLEVLSVMLARNPMCKLTPSDVHFIQRQYRAPESVIQLSVQQCCLRHMGALGYYLRQNILQFLYTPKYIDTRAHSHFQDYSQSDGSSKRVPESDIFLYNQSHSSGSRGIACIAIAIVNEKGEIIATENENVFDSMFPICPEIRDFEEIVSTDVYWGQNCDKNESQELSKAYIEFRIWKQGRVNLESLVQKLKAAVRHANWDLITEYNFLPTPLAEPLYENSEDIDEADVRNNPLELNGYELGEKGKLRRVYQTTMAYWFQFALDLSAPAIKKHVVILERRHSLQVILKELQNLVHSHALDTTARTFVQWSRQPFIDNRLTQDELLLSKTLENADGNVKWLSKASEQESSDDLIFLPCDVTQEQSEMYVRSILIARNFNQWKASFSNRIESEQLIPKDQKLLQKFNPLILEKTFVPRQRLLLAKIQNQHIILYMYNWSKERSEKLIKQVTNLGLWLSSRSNIYSNIIMQKLGIFHHQPIRNYEQEEHNHSQYYHISDMESLAKFPNVGHADNKEWQRISSRAQTGKGAMPFSWNHMMGQVMRDAKPCGQYPPNTTDPVVKAAYDFQELRHKEKKSKDDLNKLHTMWQSRGAVPNIPISLATLNTFKQHSRLIHYCHTPLLFLPTWRLQSAATRDHSLTPPPLHLPLNAQQRSRSTSDASMKKIVSKWHTEICELMLSEYKQYLQVLGFNPIQIESQQKIEEVSILNQAFYLKKSMLGGVLLFEIHLAEPFFIVKLRVIECSRLQAKSSSALVNQFMLSFVDVCDKIKINMHLHSFTYDFHLRCIHSYIAGNCQWSLKHGYHLTNFLDDFNKYYSKAPNYARNLIYSGVVTVNNLVTPAHTLYQYLLSHEKTYDMQVFSMSDDSDDTQQSEYVLVRLQSTPLLSYHDAQDIKYTDDFDVALIVTWLEQFSQPDSRDITLKYYLMLTSKRELYPKREVESNNKIGKFRTVYSVVKSMTNSQMDSLSESSPVSTNSPSLGKQVKSELLSSSSDLHAEITNTKWDANAPESLSSVRDYEGLEAKSLKEDMQSPMAPTPPPVPESPLAPNILNSTMSYSNLTQIRQESINYLGYYSSHEQLMQQLIMSQANAARRHISNMIEQGALHCRTHLLWNRLLENRSTLTYAEFTELRSLACVEPLSRLDPRLNPLVNQPIVWYQSLAKLLQNKYQEYHKQFNAPDGNITHHLILHPNYVQAFMMLTIDMHTSRGELYAVYRKTEGTISTPFTVGDIYSLIEDFVNACCFHLWVGLCS
ncbi:PREDICTED: protein SZT2-like isoform X2 [Ceratosolen solmsi marchali]|uniref:Protein SZT2-like isoform X2 n=1 Tax=Ceratosolen solmsi marchali TaxID=326594 RepID=A0AAJ6YG51_9HYME|nr:PREDICTED: protein SZT2-like isoform X2 [Ceratosolen solmsi marchali]